MTQDDDIMARRGASSELVVTAGESAEVSLTIQ
jgi:hypothetical protein